MDASLRDGRRLWPVLFLLLLLFVACQREEATPAPAEIGQPTATSTAVPPTETPQPTGTRGATATPEPTVTPEATPTPSYAPVFEEAACEFEEPAEREVQCGYLEVPEDRSQPEGASVRLHVAIFASESEEPASDPIVYLEGGPGGDALEAVPFVFEERFAPFLANRQLIMFDQRGTGYSRPSLDCPEYKEMSLEVLDEVLTAEEQEQLFLESMAACHSRLVEEGIDLGAYDSAASAADVADLGRALGYDELNLLGISYGTRLALTIMRDHPQVVRSAILDSTYPPEVNIVEETPSNFNRALDVFFAGCEADAACEEAYPDLRSFFFDLVDEVNAEPITAPVFHAFNGQRYEARLTGDDLLAVLFQGLYSEEIIPVLPQFIYETAAGDYELLSALLSNLILSDEFVSIGMHFSVQCQDEIPFAEPADVAEAVADFPQLEAYFETSATSGQTAFAACDLWDVPASAPLENQPVQSDIPTLIMAGEYDPITPPGWGVEAREDLSNSYYLQFPGLGHGVSVAGDCPRSIVMAFLDDPASEPAPSCVAELGQPQFAVPGEEGEAVEVAPFTTELFGVELSGVAPEGWEEQEGSPGIFVRRRSALDQTALLQQAVPGVEPEQLLELLSGQFGLEEPPEPTSTHQANGRFWSLYETEAQGVPVDIALAEGESVAYLVILFSHRAERDTLYEAVFLPALEAIEVN